MLCYDLITHYSWMRQTIIHVPTKNAVASKDFFRWKVQYCIVHGGYDVPFSESTKISKIFRARIVLHASFAHMTRDALFGSKINLVAH